MTILYWNINDWERSFCEQCGAHERDHVLATGLFTRKIWVACPPRPQPTFYARLVTLAMYTAAANETIRKLERGR